MDVGCEATSSRRCHKNRVMGFQLSHLSAPLGYWFDTCSPFYGEWGYNPLRRVGHDHGSVCPMPAQFTQQTHGIYCSDAAADA